LPCFCHGDPKNFFGILPSDLFAKTWVWPSVVCRIPDNRRFFTDVSKNFKKRFEELGRKLGRTSKEYWIKLRRTLKEPSNFLDVTIKFKKKFQRTFERSFEELGKSFDGIFEVLDTVLRSS
jgi:hypothetical protein